MKRFLTLLLAMILAISCLSLVACKNSVDESDDGPKQLSFYAPDGAPALAIAKFIKDKENFGIDGEITYNVVSADKIGGVMQQGTGDFIVMPINAASKLYKANSDSPYVMASVITHGNLYIASTEEITLDGLKGKVIGVIGQGLVPDLTFRAVLKDNDLLDLVIEGDQPTDGKITIKYFSQASDMLPMLKQGKLTIGLLPEPALNNLKTKVAADKDWKTLDLQELYDSENKAYPQAVLMVRKSLVEPFEENINDMADKFGENLEWIKENTADAVAAVSSALPEGVTPSLNAGAINETVIDNCKIFWQSAEDAEQSVKDYIDKIIAVNDKSAKAITDDFFIA